MSETGLTAIPSGVERQPITYARLMEELGRLSVAFNLLETVVCYRTWELIGTEQRIGRTVTAKMSFAQVADLLRDLYVVRYPELDKQKQMKALHTAMRAASERRNNLLHTSWALITSDPTMVARSKIRFSGKGGLTRVELKSAIGEVRTAMNEVVQVINHVFALLPGVVAIGDNT